MNPPGDLHPLILEPNIVILLEQLLLLFRKGFEFLFQTFVLLRKIIKFLRPLISRLAGYARFLADRLHARIFRQPFFLQDLPRLY